MTRKAIGNTVKELPMQNERRERIIAGMCGIIRRMTRQGHDCLVLMDYDERELSIALLLYLRAVDE